MFGYCGCKVTKKMVTNNHNNTFFSILGQKTHFFTLLQPEKPVTEDGLRTTYYGLRRTDYGERRMENGELKTDN